jgi:hypothetical protein
VRSDNLYQRKASNVSCSLRRRFEQNQEDCTFTVLAILPAATENILDAIPVEQVLEELQKQKAERLSRSVGPSEIASSAPPSVADTAEDDARSSSLQTDSFIHASQIATEGDSSTGPIEGSPETGEEKKTKKSKAQLWSEMKISCTYCGRNIETRNTDVTSDNTGLYPPLYPRSSHSAHPHPTKSSRPPKLPRIRCLLSRAAVD